MFSPTQARDRRQVPGSRAFLTTDLAMVICGTRRGSAKFARMGHHAGLLIAPLDMDPGSLSWPVKDAPGITVLEEGAPKEFVLRLVQALLGDGAKLVVTINEGKASIHQRKPEG